MKKKVDRTIPYLLALSCSYESPYGLFAKEHFEPYLRHKAREPQAEDHANSFTSIMLFLGCYLMREQKREIIEFVRSKKSIKTDDHGKSEGPGHQALNLLFLDRTKKG